MCRGCVLTGLALPDTNNPDCIIEETSA